MEYQPKASKTCASKDYDPFDGDKNYNENRMPNSQEPFHFAFCNMCNTTLVVYTQFLSCQFRTEIYCSQPTDKNIYVVEKLEPQSFEKFPNQILMFHPLNMRGEEDEQGSFMHYDILVPNDFVFDKSNQVQRNLHTAMDNESSIKNNYIDNESSMNNNNNKSKRKRKEIPYRLPKDIQEMFDQLYEDESNVKKSKTIKKEFTKADHVTSFFNDLKNQEDWSKRLKNQRSAVDRALKEEGFDVRYRDLAERQQKRDRLAKKENNHNERFMEKVLRASVAAAFSGKEKDRDKLISMMETEFGDKPPKLTSTEKREYTNWLKTMNSKEKKLWEKDQKEAKSMTELRYVIDDTDYFKSTNEVAQPYYEGKWKQGRGRPVTKAPLSQEWLDSHFDARYLEIVKKVGLRRVSDPSKPGRWIRLPKHQRWLPVPMGRNTNEVSVDKKFLCQSIPIRYPQGKINSCLFSSVASALSYMKYDKIAEHIINKKVEYADVDGIEQWKGLQKLLKERNTINEDINFKVYNRKQGSKRKPPKHKLDVETLTSNHKDAMDLHVVCLIGNDGSQDHAVAIVNGMIFDSCASNAMYLDRIPLDWCCNCDGGYAKSGYTLRIRITQCRYKKSCTEEREEDRSEEKDRDPMMDSDHSSYCMKRWYREWEDRENDSTDD